MRSKSTEHLTNKNNKYKYHNEEHNIRYKVNGRSKSSKSVLFISDMHVGSAYAVCSPHPNIGDTGGEWKPNKLQKKLYDTWMWVKDSLSQKPHVLCLNGEPCDGANVKQTGQQSWSANINDQIGDAEKLLKEFSTKYFVMTRGSGYHVHRDATNYEEILANKMGAVPYSGYFEAQKGVEYHTVRTDYYLTFSIYDKVFSVTHHIGFNRWFAYRTTALAREMADMEFLKGKYWTKENTPSVIVRSHVHYFVEVRFASVIGFTTPAWKLPDAHLFKGGLGGTAPSIGAIELIIEPDGKTHIDPHILSNNDYPKHKILDLTE